MPYYCIIWLLPLQENIYLLIQMLKTTKCTQMEGIQSAHKIEMEGKGTMPCRIDSLQAKATRIEAMTKQTQQTVVYLINIEKTFIMYNYSFLDPGFIAHSVLFLPSSAKQVVKQPISPAEHHFFCNTLTFSKFFVLLMHHISNIGVILNNVIALGDKYNIVKAIN